MTEVTNTDRVAEADAQNLALSSASNASPQTYWSLVKRQYRRNKLAVIAFWFIIVMFAVALFADFLANDRPIVCSYKGTVYVPVMQEYLMMVGLSDYPAELMNADWKLLEYDWSVFPPVPYSSTGTDLINSFAAPFTGDHFLGTDQIGRDILSGLIHGARISLSIGLVAMAIEIIIGVTLGALAGYFGGLVDIVISRLIELFLNFPTFFLILTIVAFLGANIFYVMIIIGLTGWMGVARLVRGEVLRVRNNEFVPAAISLGFGSLRVIFRHVLPNSLAPVLVSVAFGVAGAILIESTLSFLGVGVPLETVTWGSALNASRGAPSAWWLAVFPGLLIFLTVVSYNLIGDGLRDATDPRLKM
ncbi:MAG: ABC transporter permease [bacterium]|nr:ABC transporter permease [Candidatus Kapabacteria bacterium]